MDTTTVMQIIKMVENQLNDNKKKMQAKGFNIETPVQTELQKLIDHLQEYIELQVSAMENSTAE
jgi:hypothetical protein